MSYVLRVDTPRGPAEATVHPPAGGGSRGLVILLHGAGTASSAAPLPALADELAGLGLSAVRFDQPYVVAGRRAPDPAAMLDACLAAALPRLTALAPDGPVGVIGRSSGARVACRTAATTGAAAVAALGFPWRPPRSPRDRGADLRAGARVCPVLVVQGDRDPFGRPDRMRGVRTIVVPGMAHTPTAAAARAAGRWLVRILATDMTNREQVRPSGALDHP